MSGFDRTQKDAGVMDYPYMCDQQPLDELQFADKIKLMNNQKSQKDSKQTTKTITSASGDALSSILIQTFVEMM